MMRTREIPAALALAAAVSAACACSRSEVADETGASLALAAPTSRTVAPGETCTVSVSVRRNKVDGPVAIRFDGLPEGVSVVEVKPQIAAGADAGTFTLHASSDAPAPADGTVTVTAASESGMSVSERFAIQVVASR